MAGHIQDFLIKFVILKTALLVLLVNIKDNHQKAEEFKEVNEVHFIAIDSLDIKEEIKPPS
ncbi:hypothetical protein C0J52_26547 [Blattella germanica]|nr:hypothetical protein C0J52_26547 [Blattella germanica]